MQSSGFTGFSPETRKFYKELSKNNNKDWFQANKHRYEEYAREPAKMLVSEMSFRFASTGLPFFADPKKSLFRVNRDIRFSANKEPYKTNLGINFPYKMPAEASKVFEGPGLYFHFDANESFIAGGMYMPPSNLLRAIREHIAENWKELFKIFNGKIFKREFPDMFADEPLKTMPRGFPADHPAADWLKLKGFTVYSNLDYKEIYSPGLADILLKKAEVIAPFMEFLHKAIEEVNTFRH